MNKTNIILGLVILLSISLLIGGMYYITKTDYTSLFNRESHKEEKLPLACRIAEKKFEKYGGYHQYIGNYHCYRDVLNKEFGCTNVRTNTVLCAIPIN